MNKAENNTWELNEDLNEIMNTNMDGKKNRVGRMKLIISNLKKTYGTVQALKGINYTFNHGIYGILGANGAGKSTMINLITDNDIDLEDVYLYYFE